MQIQKYLDACGCFRYIVLQTQGVLTIYKNHTRGNLLHKHKTIEFDAMGEGTAITSKSPKISHLFNLHDSSLGRHVNALSRKRLEIHGYSITKREPFRSENLSKYKFLAALTLHESKKSGGSMLYLFIFIFNLVTSCENQEYHKSLTFDASSNKQLPILYRRKKKTKKQTV